MSWNGTLTADSAEGSEITHAPNGVSSGQYEIVPFTAPKGGVYRFTLLGSGGNTHGTEGSRSPGGTGGLTVGYRLMQAGETVYIGAGGPRCAAFVSQAAGVSLEGIGRANMLLMAGGGGEGGANWGQSYNLKSSAGGDGGGTTGGTAKSGGNGTPGTGGGQSGAIGNMAGNGGVYNNEDDTSFWGGAGGDGYYGGKNGTGSSGGGGGSGYPGTEQVTVNGVTYTGSTTRGGGASSDANGSARVAFIAPDTIPVVFNGTRLTALYLDGVKVTSLIVDGVRLYMRKWRRKMCLA